MVLVHAPDGSGNKIVAVPVCHCGDIATGEALVAPLRNAGTPAVDLIGPMPYPVMNTLLDAGFPKGARNYWRSAFFKELDDEVVGVLVDAFERVPSPMSGHPHRTLPRCGQPRRPDGDRVPPPRARVQPRDHRRMARRRR